jgi:hypothetical protein
MSACADGSRFGEVRRARAGAENGDVPRVKPRRGTLRVARAGLVAVSAIPVIDAGCESNP